MIPSPTVRLRMVRAVHIIDDDDAVRDSLAVLLELNDLPVATYDSAQAFLDALETGAEGCVVTDVQMPAMTGLELLAILHDGGYDLPVIVATGRSHRAMADQAMAHGAQALVEKPFAPQAFVATVRDALAAA